jgi:hypothetical protein
MIFPVSVVLVLLVSFASCAPKTKKDMIIPEGWSKVWKTDGECTKFTDWNGDDCPSNRFPPDECVPLGITSQGIPCFE